MLDDRDLAGRQPGDLVRVDVGADDLVAEVGEARTGGEARRSRFRRWRSASWPRNLPDRIVPGPGQHRGPPAGRHYRGRDGAAAVRRRTAAGRDARRRVRRGAQAASASGCGSGPANEMLAGLADWLIGRPLSALVILLVAWIVAKIVRRHRPQGDLQRRRRRPRRGGAGAADGRRRRTDASPSRTPAATARATSIAAVVTSTVTRGHLGDRHAARARRARRRPGPADRRRRDRRRSPSASAPRTSSRTASPACSCSIEDQYGIGDSVDLGVASGAVERITLRTTVLRGQDGTVWHVPNGEIRRVGNRSKLYSVAVLDVHVAYDADLGRTRQVVHDVAQEVCESRGLRRRRAGRARAARRRGGRRPTASRCGCSCKTGPGAQFRLQRALREAIKARPRRGRRRRPAAAAARGADRPTPADGR